MYLRLFPPTPCTWILLLSSVSSSYVWNKWNNFFLSRICVTLHSLFVSACVTLLFVSDSSCLHDFIVFSNILLLQLSLSLLFLRGFNWSGKWKLSWFPPTEIHHALCILPRLRRIRLIRWSDTSWYLTSQVQYPPSALLIEFSMLLAFTFPKLRPIYIRLGAQYHMMLKTLLVLSAHTPMQHHMWCVNRVRGKQTIVSVPHKVCLKSQFNDCLKEGEGGGENVLIQTRHGQLALDIRRHC